MPRAELRAVLSILERVPADAKITIKVDASYLLGFRSDPEAKCRSDNGEMWLECWRLIISKRIDLSVVKIARSHASGAMVTAGIISERDRIGNDHADRLAELGAAMTIPTQDQIDRTMEAYKWARYAQLRLASATLLQLNNSPGRPRAVPPVAVRKPKKVVPTVNQHITRLAMAGHDIILAHSGKCTRARCRLCGNSCSARLARYHYSKNGTPGAAAAAPDSQASTA